MTELAYCAGVLDSDGHIGVHVNWYKTKSGPYQDSKQPTYQPRMSVKQVDPGAVDLFHELFAGMAYTDNNNKRGSQRPVYIWSVHSRACRVPLEALRPYLRIKDRQADLALELCTLNASPRRHGFDFPAVVPGEPMVPLAEAAARAGRSYATAIQCVQLDNIPFERRKRVGRGTPSIFVPESYLDTWRARGRGARRRPEVSESMAAVTEAIKALNSGVRGQTFLTPRRSPNL